MLQDLIRANAALSTRFYPAYTRVCRSLRDHDIQTATQFLHENIQPIRGTIRITLRTCKPHSAVDVSCFQQALEPLLDEWKVFQHHEWASSRLTALKPLVDLLQTAADELLKTRPAAHVLWQRMQRTLGSTERSLHWPSSADGDPPAKRRRIPILRCSDVM